MTQEPAQYPNQLVAGDDIHLPSGNNCNNGNIHVYCDGITPGRCLRFVTGNPTLVYAVYSVNYCGDASTGTIYFDQYISGAWSNVTSGAGCDGATGYCYWTWNIYETGKLRFRFGSDINNPTDQWVFYIGWFYAHIYIQDYAGTPLSGITTTWSSTDGQSGTEYTSVINVLVPNGTSVTYSCAEGGTGCFPVAAEVCSTTISNITADTNSITKMYPIDFCLTLDVLVAVGATLTACFNVVIKNQDISDSPRSCVISILENGSEIGLENMYPNTWSDEYTLIDGTLFSFRCGAIFYGVELNVIEIFEFCFSNRPNKSINIDNSIIYVDCINGNNTYSGRCSFTNAVKTITYAQSLIANNGTIYVKYGNCIEENLNAVFYPTVDSVTISPRQDDTTEGTGTLYISDA